MATAVQSKKINAGAKTPSAPQLSTPEETAKKLGMSIVSKLSEAVSTGNRTAHKEAILAMSGQVQKLPSSGPRATLTKELHKDAASYFQTGKLPAASVQNLKTTFSKASEIETALKDAYQFTLLSKNSVEVRKCLDAAKTAIDKLPKQQEQQKSLLSARLSLINGLISHKNKPKASAPQITQAKVAKTIWSHPATKVALLALGAVAVNSVLHGFGVMPSWTRFATVQGIFGLNNAVISKAIQTTGATSKPVEAAAQNITHGIAQASQQAAPVVETSSYLYEIATAVVAAGFFSLLYFAYDVYRAIDPDTRPPARADNLPFVQPQPRDAAQNGAPAIVMEDRKEQPKQEQPQQPDDGLFPISDGNGGFIRVTKEHYDALKSGTGHFKPIQEDLSIED